MIQVGGTHGPHADDALKKEVRSELRAGHATREEWHEPEPPGEDQPEATWALAGRPSPDRGPDADLLELRSDLARHLDRAVFPARRGRLLATLARRHAPQPLADLVAQLPARATFRNVGDVARALGLPAETRGGGGP
jgi:hypothetical protein